ASNPASCQTMSVTKKAARKLLREANVTSGPCQPLPPDPGTTTTTAAPAAPPTTCPTGQCASNTCGPRCVCVAVGGGKKRCLAKGACPAGVCTSDSCGTGCTCINPGGSRSQCVSVGS